MACWLGVEQNCSDCRMCKLNGVEAPYSEEGEESDEDQLGKKVNE